MAAAQKEIDEGLYSRQLYVFGHDAQRRMQQSSVLLIGLGGLGVEIAKNIILAGVKSVGLLDRTRSSTKHMGAQFYLSKSDEGKSRATSCRTQLAELNSYVNVHVVDTGTPSQLLSSKRYNVVVATETTVSDQVSWNELCRENGVKFISADIRGLLGSIFVDLGPKHQVCDKDGERPIRGLIDSVSAEYPAVVTVSPDRRHGLSSGDYITFDEIKGRKDLNGMPARPIKYISAFKFSIDIDMKGSPISGGYFQQVKQQQEVEFHPLKACISKPSFSSDMGDGKTLHCLFQALSKFQENNSGALPDPTSAAHIQSVVNLAEEFCVKILKEEGKKSIDTKHIAKLARCAGAVIGPMAAVIGGIAGQEVLKAVSGKFTPISQFYYFSAGKCIPDGIPSDLSQFRPTSDRYADYVSVFGSKVQTAITNLRVFLVGAGAIGCEMMKNFSMMGACSSKSGHLVVTDMDAIERSNLNRQFLFRPSDVGSLKSECAARAAKAINGDLNVTAHSHRVGAESENIYNGPFWTSLNAVVTALDNVDARLYLDDRCIFFSKPMLDSGTLGTKGNTQVVLPHITESYGSSRDPPEDSIPLCTLHNFPYKIEHTIQWARDKFEGLFKNKATEVNSYLTDSNYLSKLAEDPINETKALETVSLALGKEKPLNFENCITWARLRFEEEFHNNIIQLLTALPADQVDAEGNPFWTGHKRPPSPLKFDSENTDHIEFIIAAANLQAEMYGLRGSRDVKVVKDEVKKVKVEKFVAIKGKKVAKNDEELEKMMEEEADGVDFKLTSLKESLPKPSSLTGYRLIPVDFEKDDPTNFHIDFVTACSNLRAANYKIKPANKHQTKQIAGKIIPAIATTTALVSGLVCLELYKLVQDMKIESFSNTYANLAISHITASEPLPPAFNEVKLKDKTLKFSLWDRMEVRLGAKATLEELCDHFEEKYGLHIVMLSFGKALLFSKYGFMAKKKNKLRLKMSMPDLAETVGKVKIDRSASFLMFEAMVTTEDDEDVDIPSVRFWMN